MSTFQIVCVVLAVLVAVGTYVPQFVKWAQTPNSPTPKANALLDPRHLVDVGLALLKCEDGDCRALGQQLITAIPKVTGHHADTPVA